MAEHETTETVIAVKNVSKYFAPSKGQRSIKQAVTSIFKDKEKLQKGGYWALKDVSFEVHKGEFFGIVGRNGSGKSTLLKMMAGVYSETNGSIDVTGKLVPFIELGVGFNSELTGKDNVFLNGALLGFDRKEMTAMYDEIVAFAELEEHMDVKLKNFSSGMQVRLAFSIAIRAKSDILLLDEVLAVGDVIFQKKCFEYFKTLKKDKKTVVLVSHDSNVLEEYCDRGVLLEEGVVHSEGKIKGLVKDYIDLMNTTEEASESTSATVKEERRWGTGHVSVTSATIKNPEGKLQKIFADEDATVCIEVTFTAPKDEQEPICGITIENAQGVKVFESNTKREKIKVDPFVANKAVTLQWEVPNVFNTGTYSVSPAVASYDSTEMYDWRDGLVSFKVRKAVPSSAIVNTAHKITATKAE